MSSNDRKVAYLEREVAEELLDLVDDRPGEADEKLLDEAVESIASANGGLPPEAQQAVARGEAIAVGLEPEEAQTLTILIEENTEADGTMLASVGRSLKSKLRAAAKKARRK